MLRSRDRACIALVLERLCRENRSQEFETFAGQLANASGVEVRRVKRLLELMAEKGWITITKGRRLNSKLWVYYTRGGRKEYIVRSRAAPRSAPRAHSLIVRDGVR